MFKPVPEKYPQVKDVSDAERINIVKEIFSTITTKYDFLNHLLSLRRDIAWRRFAIKKMNFFRTNKFLDVACGTGDGRLIDRYRSSLSRGSGHGD